MTRRRFRKQAVSPSLFPFLAVLVCTMGALIVLLVLVVQQARVYAATAAEQKVNREEEDLAALKQRRIETEDLQWQREVLETQRTELTNKLSDGRLELGHLEDHIRRLEDRLKQLQSAALELEQLEDSKAAGTDKAESELAELRLAIDEASRRLAVAQEEAKNRPQAFAIIPYEGANGTRRRPIYVECTESSIVIQPEGVVLKRHDFQALGPGNPLDAALRATREYWARHGGAQEHGEPYPLLIVRPNGTMAYNYAREALKSWDDEFGYELIDADMELAYPDRDEQLAELLTETIATARERQQLLIAAMPSQFDQPNAGIVATPTRGGFRRVSPGGAGFDEAGEGGGYGGDEGDGSFRPGPAPGSEASAGMSDEPQQDADGANGSSQSSTAGAQSRPGPGGTGGQATRPGASISGMAGRGANWGVPKASSDATAYQIPVRIICQPDRLVILPRPSENVPATEIMAADPLSGSIDDFVRQLWKQIDRWSEPPVGGYWLPVLEVYVPPGSEQRFVDLRNVLKGSGIQVQRQAK